MKHTKKTKTRLSFLPKNPILIFNIKGLGVINPHIRYGLNPRGASRIIKTDGLTFKVFPENISSLLEGEESLIQYLYLLFEDLKSLQIDTNILNLKTCTDEEKDWFEIFTFEECKPKTIFDEYLEKGVLVMLDKDHIMFNPMILGASTRKGSLQVSLKNNHFESHLQLIGYFYAVYQNRDLLLQDYIKSRCLFNYMHNSKKFKL